MDQKRLIKRKQVQDILSISPATIHRLIKYDPEFPRPFKIGRDNVFEEPAILAFRDKIIAGYNPITKAS